MNIESIKFPQCFTYKLQTSPPTPRNMASANAYQQDPTLMSVNFCSPHPRSTELKWTPGEELQRRSPQAKSKWRPASPLTELKSRPDRTRNEKLVDNETEGIQCKQLLSTSLGAIFKTLDASEQKSRKSN